MNRIINAPRDRVYAALGDPEAVARWRFPTGMTCEVHELDAREGGAINISLTFDATDRAGKTHGRTDTYHGRFVTLVPDELVVEADELESERALDARRDDDQHPARGRTGRDRARCRPRDCRQG